MLLGVAVAYVLIDLCKDSRYVTRSTFLEGLLDD